MRIALPLKVVKSLIWACLPLWGIMERFLCIVSGEVYWPVHLYLPCISGLWFFSYLLMGALVEYGQIPHHGCPPPQDWLFVPVCSQRKNVRLHLLVVRGLCSHSFGLDGHCVENVALIMACHAVVCQICNLTDPSLRTWTLVYVWTCKSSPSDLVSHSVCKLYHMLGMLTCFERCGYRHNSYTECCVSLCLVCKSLLVALSGEALSFGYDLSLAGLHFVWGVVSAVLWFHEFWQCLRPHQV